jgi:hypothetical protein
MKFIIQADKITTALKWATKNLGPVVSKGGITLMKETVEVNGVSKKVLPVYRHGANWMLKDLTRDDLDSVLEVNDDLLSKYDTDLFEQYINDTLSDADAVIFTLKYL